MFFYNRILTIFVSLFFCLVLTSIAFAQTEPVFYGEEVVVTAARYPQFVSDVPWSVTIISEDEIKSLGVANVGDAVRMVAGTYVKSDGGLGGLKSVSLRGLTSNHVIILVDGMRMNSVLLGYGIPEDIMVSDIERIEIIRAPLSAIYGADAVGGVINVITKKAEEERRIVIDALGGTFSTYKFNLSDSFYRDNFGYYLSAGYLSSGGFRANSDYLSQRYLLEMKSKINNDGLVSVVFDQYISERGTPYTITFPSLTARRNDDNIRFGITYNFKIDNKNEVEANIYKVRQKQISNYNPSLYADLNFLSEFSIVELRRVSDLNPSWRVSYGLEMREDHGVSDASGDHTLSNKALFLQSENKIGRTYSFIFGARGDSHSQYGESINPRIGMVARPFEFLIFKTSYGLAFRAPTQNDLFTYLLDTFSSPFYSYSYESKGHPDLRPERGDMFDLSLQFNPTSKTTIILNGYESTMKDYIRWQETYRDTDWLTYDVSTWEAVNIPIVNVEGFEISIEQKIIETLSVFANYANENTLDISNQKVLDYAPREKYNIGVRYKDDIGNAASFSFKHVGKRYADRDNARLLAQYNVLDISVSKEFGLVTVSLVGENLADVSYQETEGYPMPGRMGYIGVSMNI